LFYNLKQTIMKIYSRSKNRTGLQQFRSDFKHKCRYRSGYCQIPENPKTAGIISAGLSPLVTGLITAMDDDILNPNNN
jgi:hypothetical protein